MKDKLQSLLDNLNQGYQCGGIEIMPYEPETFDDFTLLPTDITIYYDFVADDEPVEDQAFNEYESALELTNQLMAQNDWQLINELDGSGGGLYYGSSTYRKIT